MFKSHFLAILWCPQFCQFWQFCVRIPKMAILSQYLLYRFFTGFLLPILAILCSGGIKLPILAILWSPFLANFGNFVFHPNPTYL